MDVEVVIPETEPKRASSPPRRPPTSVGAGPAPDGPDPGRPPIPAAFLRVSRRTDRLRDRLGRLASQASRLIRRR